MSENEKPVSYTVKGENGYWSWFNKKNSFRIDLPVKRELWEYIPDCRNLLTYRKHFIVLPVQKYYYLALVPDFTVSLT